MASKSIGEINRIIKKYLNVLLANNIQFEKAYLFGSYVKGKPRKDSDIDIAIFADKWLPDKHEARVTLMKFTHEFGEVIEPHPFNLEDIENPDPFVEEILKHGKLIATN